MLVSMRQMGRMLQIAISTRNSRLHLPVPRFVEGVGAKDPELFPRYTRCRAARGHPRPERGPVCTTRCRRRVCLRRATPM